MIQKIATDVLEKLNTTQSSDFEDKVGLEAHLRKLESLLCLESDEVKMIGIWGPAGIGKTTIARALYNQISSSFQLRCFMGNLKGSCMITMGVDDHDLKLSLQTKLLSKILNQKDMRVHHLGAIKERLHDQRVLIVLDDVDDPKLLEALANELSWFGSGSRIVVTTEDKTILKISDIYHVDFPSKKDALEIFCRSAFKQSSVPYGFEELAKKVVEFCGNLPLGLCVVGSSLHRESKCEWKRQLAKIETSLHREIENINAQLRMGYDRLSKKDQFLFLHIACIFNNHDVDQVTSILADSGLDVTNGLKTLAEKSLVYTNRRIVMHYLLQQLGRQIVFEQSDQPGKCKFLVEMEEIRDVLENETGTASFIGISLDTSKIYKDDNVSVGKRAFEEMRNLRILRFYKDWFRGEATLQIPEDIDYLPRLRLLHWDEYPRKSLPPRFQPDRLVKLHMRKSKLEKLWEGIKPLPNLKSIDLGGSFKLKEIPNLLKATNLETLTLERCHSLVELPSSIRNLQKLKRLDMQHCSKLQSIPPNINLASLEEVDMSDCKQLTCFPDISSNIMELRVCGTKIEVVPSSIRNLHKLKRLIMARCEKLRVIPTDINLPSLEVVFMNYCSQLESFPDISSNIKELNVEASKIKDVPPSVVRCWSRLESLKIGSGRLKTLTYVPRSVWLLDLSNSEIEKIPDCIIDLPHLERIFVKNCQKLVSIPALFSSLEYLNASGCVSLERVCFSVPNETRSLTFYDCLQLDEESRRGIIQQSIRGEILLPGKEIPAEFTHKATGKSITIPLASGGEATFSASSRFKACILLSSMEECSYQVIRCRLRSNGDGTVHSFSRPLHLSDLPSRSKHLFIFSGYLFPQRNRCHKVDVTISEITFKFSCEYHWNRIIECGVQIMAEETEGSSSSQVDNCETESRYSEVDYESGGGDEDYETDGDETGSSSREVDYESGGGDEDYETDGDETGSSSREVDYESGGKDEDGDEILRSFLRTLGLDEDEIEILRPSMSNYLSPSPSS